ncbi:hypothetical protein L1887_48600 [Cichorium endivia]|nr:hypothetical protein L1887_48600 [Cichorium endivia]
MALGGTIKNSGRNRGIRNGLDLVDFLEGGRTHTDPLHSWAGLCVFRDLEAVDLGGVDARVGDSLSELVGLNGPMGGLVFVCLGFLLLVLECGSVGVVLGRNDAGEQIAVALVEQMRECRTEKRAVHSMESRTGWRVVVDAVWAEELDRIQTGKIRSSTRKHRVRMAEDARTVSEMSSFVLVHHLLHAVSCKDVALVNKPIQQFGGGLDDRHKPGGGTSCVRVVVGRWSFKLPVCGCGAAGYSGRKGFDLRVGCWWWALVRNACVQAVAVGGKIGGGYVGASWWWKGATRDAVVLLSPVAQSARPQRHATTLTWTGKIPTSLLATAKDSSRPTANNRNRQPRRDSGEMVQSQRLYVLIYMEGRALQQLLRITSDARAAPSAADEDYTGSNGMQLLVLLARAGTLGLLDGSLVGLRTGLTGGTEKTRGSLEGALEIAGGGLAPDPELGHVGLERVLEREDGLDDERVGVAEVEVHEADHGAAHEDAARGLGDLGEVVVAVGGGDELAGLLRHGVLGVDVLDDGKVVGLLDADRAVVVHGEAEELHGDVAGTRVGDVLGLVVKGDALGDLHGAKHEGLR